MKTNFTDCDNAVWGPHKGYNERREASTFNLLDAIAAHQHLLHPWALQACPQMYIKVLKVIGKFNINLKVPRWAAFLSWCQLLRPERAPPWTRLSAAQQESRAGISLDPYFAPDQSVWISLWSKLRPDHAWVLLCVEPENVVRQRDPGQLHWQRRRGWGTYMRLLFFLKTSTNPSLHLEWSPLLIDWSWLTNQ